MDVEKLQFGQIERGEYLSKVIKRYNPKSGKKYELKVHPLKGYVSGSIYAGEWSPINMEGEGAYVLPHGVIYEGQMKNGMFHGKGVLTYPLGQVIVGEWYEGEILSWTFNLRNIKQCALDTYCKNPDRRFLTTLYSHLKPAGKEHKTNDQPTKKIPEGCYDVVDGFYNPKTLWVHSSKSMNKILYMPAPRRIPVDPSYFKDEDTRFIKKVPFVPIYNTVQWIEEHCRKAWDEPTGYKPELFEYWFSGSRKQAEILDMKLKSDGGKFVWNKSVCDEFLSYFEIVARKKREEAKVETEKETEAEKDSSVEEEHATVSSELISPEDSDTSIFWEKALSKKELESQKLSAFEE